MGREEVQIGGCEHPGAAITSLFSLSSGDLETRRVGSRGVSRAKLFFFFNDHYDYYYLSL